MFRRDFLYSLGYRESVANTRNFFENFNNFYKCQIFDWFFRGTFQKCNYGAKSVRISEKNWEPLQYQSNYQDFGRIQLSFFEANLPVKHKKVRFNPSRKKLFLLNRRNMSFFRNSNCQYLTCLFWFIRTLTQGWERISFSSNVSSKLWNFWVRLSWKEWNRPIRKKFCFNMKKTQKIIAVLVSSGLSEFWRKQAK